MELWPRERAARLLARESCGQGRHIRQPGTFYGPSVGVSGRLRWQHESLKKKRTAAMVLQKQTRRHLSGGSTGKRHSEYNGKSALIAWQGFEQAQI